jgi:uncharacterized OB-fold protein
MTQEQEMFINCFTCDDCGYTTFAQKVVCAKCTSSKISAVQVARKGTLVDFTVISFAPENYKDLAPFTSVLVQLENGCKLFGIIKGENLDIPLGSPVTMVGRDEARGTIFFELDQIPLK